MRIIYILLTMFLIGCSAGSSKETNETDPKERDVILNARFETLEGEEFELSKFAGKTIFLNLWATWCKPCIYEMPSISRASEILGNEVVVIAASDESIKRIKKFKEKYPNFRFELVRIKSSVMNYGVQALPTTFLINKKGEIVHEEIGGKEWDNPNQIDFIKGL